MSKHKKESLIYILTNPSFPSYIKIGKTTDLSGRLNSLNDKSCLPFSFRVYATYAVEENDLKTVEDAIHELIDLIDYELRAREESESGRTREREFFALDAETTYEIFKRIAILRGDENNLKKHEQTAKEKREEQTAMAIEKRARAKPWPFSKYGIPVGSELKFFYDESIAVKVVDEKQVEFEGELYSLSNLAAMLLMEHHGRKSTTARGPQHFTYEGRKLSDIREGLDED